MPNSDKQNTVKFKEKISRSGSHNLKSFEINSNLEKKRINMYGSGDNSQNTSNISNNEAPQTGSTEFDTSKKEAAKTQSKLDNIENYSKLLSPWLDTRFDYIENTFWKEPCFSGKNEIQEHSYRDGNKYSGESFNDIFWRGYYGISELPIFGWSEYSGIKPDDFYILPSTLAKFLYCFFIKICGFPLYIAYLAGRFFLMMLKAFAKKIHFIGVCIANTLMYIVFPIGYMVSLGSTGSLFPTETDFIPYQYDEYVTNDDGDIIGNRSVDFRPALGSMIIGFFGFNIPFHVISPELGQKYGRGEIGVFIFLVMGISAIVITLTGINVVVIMLAFFYFMLKTFIGIKDKAMGKDLRKGSTSS